MRVPSRMLVRSTCEVSNRFTNTTSLPLRIPSDTASDDRSASSFIGAASMSTSRDWSSAAAPS
jgi:hypothetical protein